MLHCQTGLQLVNRHFLTRVTYIYNDVYISYKGKHIKEKFTTCLMEHVELS